MKTTRYGIEVDLSYQHKQTCPRCKVKLKRDRSGDNLHCYGLDTDGRHLGAICFSCDYKIPSEQWLEENGETFIEEEEEDLMGLPFNDDVHAKLKARTGVDSKNYRGIRKDTSKFFGVRYGYSEEDASITQVYYPVTEEDYNLSGYKVRSHPKDFRSPGPYGETGKNCNLFGQFRFKTFADTVLIVGGEHDVLAAYQMLNDAQRNKSFNPPAVVSATVGESAAFRQVANQFEFFDRFKKIIVCMDNDAAGKEATKKIVDVLPKGRVYTMPLRLKDPNQYIQDGRERDFISDFWAAKPYTPEGVKSAADGFDEIRDELTKPRLTLPGYMHRMQDMMGGGIIQGRILNVLSDTSCGKSTHVNRMVYHWIFNSPVTPTIVSLEATASQYMLEMLSIHMEVNLMWKMTTEELLDFLETEEGQRIKNELCYKEDGQNRFFIIDDRAGSIKDMEKELEMLYKKHGSKLFVIDVLTDLLRGSSEQYSEDHMNFQRNMAKNGVTIANVLHTRKPPQNPDGRPRKVSEYDALGTGSFVQSSAYNIVLNRDKLSGNDLTRNTTEADLPKCRGGKTGPAGQWYYEFNKSKCHDLEDFLKANPEMRKLVEKKD